MKVGDEVVFLDDEPELDLRESARDTVTGFHEPDYTEFRLADGRTFTALDTSLEPRTPHR
ncbi:hypothetical protein [Amycolatopsis sp. PS_44_ISF1]|uniref:hypothetical protein n=1 Tax=Amycolatopsis sp. PS_44_ISF1 TaxID=2974917 RepID=UPI0028DD7E9F|nr:hypothetical protein [Amycolatopsis sp. PS_44_ISF1]MDT8913533.1 hypothetical protein [Amycolatopsis sp. PS_44_ISF1]